MAMVRFSASRTRQLISSTLEVDALVEQQQAALARFPDEPFVQEMRRLNNLVLSLHRRGRELLRADMPPGYASAAAFVVLNQAEDCLRQSKAVVLANASAIQRHSR